MSQRIGPTFVDELRAAGLGDVPLAWTADGELSFVNSTSLEVRAAIKAVLDAHDPGPGLLAAVRRERQAYINQRRDAFIGSRVESGGVMYDTDVNSVNNLTAAILFMFVAQSLGVPVPATISWRDANNVDRDLTFADLFQLGAAIFTKVQTAHVTARQVKDKIETMTDLEAIKREDWPL